MFSTAFVASGRSRQRFRSTSSLAAKHCSSTLRRRAVTVRSKTTRLTSEFSTKDRCRYCSSPPATPLVDADVLGVQELRPVEPDPHAHFEQLRIVGALCQVHQDVIDRPRQDQIDLHAPQDGRFKCIEQGLARDEVRGRDDDAAAGAVNQGGDEVLDSRIRVVGPAREDLRDDRTLVSGRQEERRIVQHLVGFQEPVGRENGLQFEDDRTSTRATSSRFSMPGMKVGRRRCSGTPT